jgi:hypothetical protein
MFINSMSRALDRLIKIEGDMHIVCRINCNHFFLTFLRICSKSDKDSDTFSFDGEKQTPAVGAECCFNQDIFGLRPVVSHRCTVPSSPAVTRRCRLDLE